MLPRKLDSIDFNSYSNQEEWVNTATHLLGFVLALAGLVLMLVKSTNLMEYAISCIYGLSLAFMFLSSTLYHTARKPNRRAMLRKVDHIAIYGLIAGTYTPFLLLAVGGMLGLYSTIVVWSIGVGGIVFKSILGHKYPKLGLATYAIMGWLAIFLIYPIYQALSGAAFTLLLAGGLCYTLGIPFYIAKSRHYSHAIWHVLVFAGAFCHFFAIYLYIL